MRLFAWLLALLLGLGWVPPAQAQWDDPNYEEAFVDGAIHPSPPKLPEKEPPTLIGANLQPTRIQLPRTQPPTYSGGEGSSESAHPILEVGYTLEAPPNILGRARWYRARLASNNKDASVKEGWICRVELYSEGAVGMRLQLRGRLPDGVRMLLYEPNGSVVIGPLEARLDESDNWWAPTLWSNPIGLEVFVPEGVNIQAIPEIVAIGYMYAGIEPDFAPAELGCHLDVTCYPTYANEARAVARILYPRDGGWWLCTGQLLNRTGTDFAPIFMTANHCISTQASAHGMEAYWFYQTSTCNGTPPSLNTVPRTQGALLLKHHTNTDWTILGLYDPPSGDYYLGWDSGGWGSGNSASTIHHPGGTYKRITFSTSSGTMTGCGFSLWRTDITVGNGTIEGGSSGSAVLDSSRRVRGPASCAQTNGTDANGNPIWRCPPLWAGYGRMDLAFGTIRWYIWEMANPTYVDRAATGDPGNEGDTERGTSSNPFNTVYEGTFCVPTNGTVRIVPGNYNERFRIWRPMRLERSGTSGVVRIGAP